MLKFIGKRTLLAVAVLAISHLAHAHENHGHEAPWQACSEAKKNDRCEYSNGQGDLFRGSCQAFSDALMCVRNQPIIKAASAPAGIELSNVQSSITAQSSENPSFQTSTKSAR